MKLLVIEDDEAIRETLRFALAAETEPIETIYCASLTCALEIIRVDCPDVALLDLNLIDSQGEETARRVLAHKADLAVIVYSGYVDDNLKERLKQIGVKDVVSKPFDLATLIGIIRTHASPGLAKLNRIIRRIEAIP